MGEMGNVRCITIIHPLHEIKNYRMYAAFFRLLGIFVCEKTTGEKIDDLGDWLFEIYHNETSGEYTEPLPVIQKMVNDRVIDEEMGQILQKAFDIFLKKILCVPVILLHIFLMQEMRMFINVCITLIINLNRR